MSEKAEALQAAESLEQAIQFYSAGLENSDNHMTLLAFAADKFRRLHAENERLNAVALQAQNAAIDLTKKNERLREALALAERLAAGRLAMVEQLAGEVEALRRERT